MSEVSRTRELLFLAAAIAAMAVAAGALYAIWFDEPAWPPPAPGDAGADAGNGQPLTSRLLIVIHDSLNRAAGDDRGITPFLAETGVRGVRGVLTVPGPTLTGISLTAFGTGVSPPLRAAFTNFRLDRWPDEDFPALAGRIRPLATAYFGDVTWSRLFGPATFEERTYLSDSLVVAWKDGLSVKDRESMEAALATAPRAGWNLMVVHLTSTDKLAHNHHGRPREADGRESDYGRGARLQDAFARDLWRAAGPEWTTIFLLSDHGCTPSGAHGSFDPVTREAPWAAAGPGIRSRSKRIDLDATALAPLWCRLFGARAPRRAESSVPVEVLALEAEDVARTLDLNYAAGFRAASAYLEGRGHGPLDPKEEESPRLQAWFDIDREQPEAAVSRLLSAETGVRARVAAAEADSRRWRFAAGLGVAALAAFGLLTTAARAGRRSLPRAAGIAVLALGALWLAEAGRDLWVYGLMSFAAGSWGPLGEIRKFIVPGLVFGAAAVAGKAFPGKRRESGAGAVSAACVLVLGGHPAVAWTYGPVVETALALLFGAAGWLAGRAPVPAADPSRPWWRPEALCASLAGAGFLVWLAGRWISPDLIPDRESIFRVPDSDDLRVQALALFLVHAAWTWSGRRRSSPAAAAGIAGSGLVVYGLSDAARATGTAGVAVAACVAFVAAAAWWLGGAARRGPDGAAGLALLALALFRLLAGDANVVLAAIVAAVARGLFASLRPLSAPGAVVLAVFLEGCWWVAQGYAWKLTAFDPTPAFLLVRGRLDPVLGIPLPVLQHALPWIWILGPAAGAVAAGGNPRPVASLARVAAPAFALRALLTLLIVPRFGDEAWYFLTASHYIVFESGRGILLLLGLLAVLACRRREVGPVRVEAA